MTAWWNTVLAGDPAAWTVVGGLATLWLAFGFWPLRRRGGRPWFYRGRRRRTPGHRGAHAGWSPAAEHANLDAHQLTPTELLPHHIVQPAVTVPDDDALAGDVHDALAGVDEATALFGDRLDALLAGFDQAVTATYSGWRREHPLLDDETGQWSTAEYQALLAAEQVTV